MKTDNLTDAYHFGETPDETIASSSTDCIYRADAERAIADVISRGGTEAEILTEIHFLPTADVVERKKGHWVIPVPGDGEPYCSECKEEAIFGVTFLWSHSDLTNYCPHCGAHMEEADDA